MKHTYTEDDVRRRSTIQILEYARSLDNYNQYGKEDIDKNIAWLEKQGKKPQGKSALEAINEKNIDNQNCLKPTDRVESKFKIGDKIRLKSKLLNDIFGVIGYEPEGYRITNISNGLTYFMSYSIEHYYELVEEEVGLVDNLSSRWVNEFNLPEGYIFKDERGNEIHALKIVLEKANTLKIQSDNMETETHRGYYTSEEETTNKSKKVAWFTFGDTDFADKVELDLSNRELIQEDGKWFVVKKRKEYPKTYVECCKVLGYSGNYDITVTTDVDNRLFNALYKLKVCRDAYWKIAGEEMGLGKPWEPSKDKMVYSFYRHSNEIETNIFSGESVTFEFPTKEMRDAFYENFKSEIEFCKELL